MNPKQTVCEGNVNWVIGWE